MTVRQCRSTTRTLVQIVLNGLLVALFTHQACAASTKTNNKADLFVDIENILQTIDEKFVGLTLDTTLIRDGWLNFDFQSKKLKNLAHGLAPSFLRLGGTSCDMLTFDPGKTTLYKPMTRQQEEDFLSMRKKFIMSGRDWDLINTFCSAVGWDLLFDLNVLIRQDGRWDPTNALLLMNYTESRGYKLAGFELGNEPNSLHHTFGQTVSASALAKDFIKLCDILRNSTYFKSAVIVGPDTTKVEKPKTAKYFEEFLASGGAKAVNKATFHHYYIDGRTATVDDFMDSSTLDGLKVDILTAVDITHSHAPGTPVFLGETASAYGGGAEGLSDAYVAGFMWMDKLGMSAKYGLKGVLRQSFYKGHYSLLDQDTLDPNPDYWLTILYRRLVGSLVFNVTSSVSMDTVRVYAHCTNNNSPYGYPPGSLTVYAMNLETKNVTLTLSQFKGKSLHTFWLTPGGTHGLKSKKVKLNQKVIQLVDDELPDLLPVRITSDQVTVPRQSFGFIVIPDADVQICRKMSNRKHRQ